MSAGGKEIAMNFRLVTIAAFAGAAILGNSPSFAQNAYITNWGTGSGSTVSVIDTKTNTVVTAIDVVTPSFGAPFGVAVTPDGSKVYVTDARQTPYP